MRWGSAKDTATQGHWPVSATPGKPDSGDHLLIPVEHRRWTHEGHERMCMPRGRAAVPQVMAALRRYVDDLNAPGGLEALPSHGPCSRWGHELT
jgi:hypothetical protein